MFIKRYFITLLIFLSIDSVWLLIISPNFYKDQLGGIITASPNLFAALLFYLIFIVGLLVFVVNPSIEKASIKNALMLGALFGLVSYATYDLTNLATIEDWPVLVTLVDLVWGTFLSASVAVASYLSIKWLKV